jgi:hypothetical protein
MLLLLDSFSIPIAEKALAALLHRPPQLSLLLRIKSNFNSILKGMSFPSGALRPSSISTRAQLLSILHPVRSSPGPHHNHHHHHQQLQHHRRPYSSSSPKPDSSSPSSSPSSSSSSGSQYNRSQFKILPFVTIFAIGTGSYILLVKSRTGVRKPQSNQ